MLTLETERLFLRDFSIKDWDALNAIISDPEVTHYMQGVTVLGTFLRGKNATRRTKSEREKVFIEQMR